MSVEIVAELTASPDPAELECRVAFTQILQSDQPDGEHVDFTYTLTGRVQVWFESPAGRVKSITRRSRVEFSQTTVEHRIKLVPSRESVATAAVEMELVDADGFMQTTPYGLTIQ